MTEQDHVSHRIPAHECCIVTPIRVDGLCNTEHNRELHSSPRARPELWQSNVYRSTPA